MQDACTTGVGIDVTEVISKDLLAVNKIEAIKTLFIFMCQC